MVTNYKRGYDFERKIFNKFKDRKDVALVVRSAGSHSLVDLIVLFRKSSANSILLIQCKKNGYIGHGELIELKLLQEQTGWKVLIAEQCKKSRKVQYCNLNGEVLDSFAG